MRKGKFNVMVKEYVAANPGLKRREYVKKFMEFGMTVNSASLYHFNFVTKVNREAAKQPLPVVAKVARDAKGRFIKRVAA